MIVFISVSEFEPGKTSHKLKKLWLLQISVRIVASFIFIRYSHFRRVESLDDVSVVDLK